MRRPGRPTLQFCLAAIAGLALSLPTSAQEPPRRLDPTRPAENFAAPSTPRAAPSPVVPLLREQTLPEEARGISFTFREMRLEGAISIDPATLMAEWAHEPGDVVTVAEVFAFAYALTRIYSEQGYPLSFGVVPEQEIRDGVVSVRIVEGFVDQIAVVGDDVGAGTLDRVRAIVDPLRDLRPLRMRDLERRLLLINDLPGVLGRATLSPSPNVVGGAVLTLNLARTGNGGQLDYNSFLPDELDRHAVGGTAEIAGLFAGAGALRLSAWKSAASDAYWSAAGELSAYLGDDGLRLAVEGVYSETAPTSEIMRALEYEAQALTVRASASYPLMRSRGRNLFIGASGGIVDADSELLGAPELRDRLRSVEAFLAHDSATDQSTTVLRASVEQGLDVLGAEGNSRSNAETAFTMVTGAAQRTQRLHQLRRGDISIFGSAYVQVTVNGPLLSASECAYGGRQYGRRHDAGALAGDHCAMGLLELRWTRPLPASGGSGAVQLYSFVDGAIVEQIGSLEPEEMRSVRASSAGAGVRLNVGPRARGSLEISRGLDAPRSLEGEEGWRLTGGVSLRF